MLGVAKGIGKTFGIHFSPDDHVVPILRFERFHRLEGPGYFRIAPGIERVLPPISVGIRTGQFKFSEVMTADNLAFEVSLAVRFSHDPRQALPTLRSRIVRIPEHGLIGLVKDKTEQALRRRFSTFDSETVSGQTAVGRIERSIHRFINNELKNLGIQAVRNGIIIKETRAPDKFKQTMLQVRQHQAIINSLNGYESADLIEQAIRAEFLNGLESRDGHITIMSPVQGLAPLATSPAYPAKNERKKRSQPKPKTAENQKVTGSSTPPQVDPRVARFMKAWQAL